MRTVQLHSKLVSLKDLKRFFNITEIGIVGAHISDLTPLADLPELVNVDFCDNYIQDVSTLGYVEKLYVTHLSNNPLLDASPLAQHPDIFALTLTGAMNTTLLFFRSFLFSSS